MNQIVTASDKIVEKKRELYQDLEKVKSLLDKNIISEDDYNRQKDSLLERLDLLTLNEKELSAEQQIPLQKKKRSTLWIWALSSLLLLSSVFFFLYNKQIIFPNKSDKVSSDTTETSTSVTEDDDDNTGEKFIGSWKFLVLFPNERPNDHSMDGYICDISRYGNTKTTFLFNFWDGTDYIFFLKDNNTLVSQNGGMLIKYDEGKKQLILYISKSNGEIFTKIQ